MAGAVPAVRWAAVAGRHWGGVFCERGGTWIATRWVAVLRPFERSVKASSAGAPSSAR